MPCPCRALVVPLPCRAAKGLECVFPIWFTQCGRVWFTLAMPCPCHAPTMPFFSRPLHSTAVCRRLCCGLEKNGMVGAWHGSVNQTRPHCVNQMGKTHSKPLAARHGNSMLCESALNVLWSVTAHLLTCRCDVLTGKEWMFRQCGFLHCVVAATFWRIPLLW